MNRPGLRVLHRVGLAACIAAGCGGVAGAAEAPAPDTARSADTTVTTPAPAAETLPAGPGSMRALPWKEEVDSLLAILGRRADWVFVRNGSRHSADEAVAHLRLKWKRQDGRIRSTEDFIDLCATRSSFTGRAYRVRFPDGGERDAAEVLREELVRLRGT